MRRGGTMTDMADRCVPYHHNVNYSNLLNQKYLSDNVKGDNWLKFEDEQEKTNK